MMQFQLDQAIEILQSTPAVVAALLENKSPAWLDSREGPNTFSAIDVLGHLIYGEQVDWIPRAKIILECGEAKAFDPFDRRGFGKIIESRSPAALLELFRDLRKQNLDTLEAFNLSTQQLSLTGAHPELGRVTMQQLLATWAVHDLNHISQIARVMATQYKEAVGPWHQYLGILKQAG